MIYTHYDTMPEILCDYVYEFEGEFAAVEQDNGNHSKHMMYELAAMEAAQELSKWFKTDSVFNVYATGKQINKPISEVVL